MNGERRAMRASAANIEIERKRESARHRQENPGRAETRKTCQTTCIAHQHTAVRVCSAGAYSLLSLSCRSKHLSGRGPNCNTILKKPLHHRGATPPPDLSRQAFRPAVLLKKRHRNTGGVARPILPTSSPPKGCWGRGRVRDRVSDGSGRDAGWVWVDAQGRN